MCVEGDAPVETAVPSPQFHEYAIVSPVFGSAVPVLVTEHVSPKQLCVNVGTGATLFVGSTIVTACATVVADTCHSSRTVSVTWNGVPAGLGAVKVRVGSAPLPLTVEPVDVPKFHDHTSDAAFSSVEARPSKVQTFWLQE